MINQTVEPLWFVILAFAVAIGAFVYRLLRPQGNGKVKHD